jgi:hypothetical protein
VAVMMAHFLRRTSLSQQIQFLLILTANPSDAPFMPYNGHIILSSRRPMTMMSGVLESPWAALSIRYTWSLIGRLFANRTGQKGG